MKSMLGSLYPSRGKEQTMSRQRYATTHYETAERKKEAVNGTLHIEFHNGLKWYVVTWYEREGE